jgi:hypothetical protein
MVVTCSGFTDKGLFSTAHEVLESTQQLIPWLPGAFYYGMKRPGRQADHSPPYSAGAATPLPHAPS